MFGKMILRTAIFGAASMIAWNSPIGDTIRNGVENVTSGYQTVSGIMDPTQFADNFFDQATGASQSATLTQALSCEITLLVPESGPKDGIVTDLRDAAQDLEDITSMTVNVTRDPDAVTGETIHANWINDTQMTQIAGDQAYAVVQTLPNDDGTFKRTLYINEDTIYNLTRGTGAQTRYNVLLHELGHLAGVQHQETGNLMSATPSLETGLTQHDKDLLNNATQHCAPQS